MIEIAYALSELMPFIKTLLPDHAQKIANIAKKITRSEDPLPQLKDSPELMLNLYKALMEFEKEVELAYLKDRAHAREMRKDKSHLMFALAVSGLFACMGLMLCGHLSGEAIGLLSMCCGIFGACLKDIYAFEFGNRRDDTTRKP